MPQTLIQKLNIKPDMTVLVVNDKADLVELLRSENIQVSQDFDAQKPAVLVYFVVSMTELDGLWPRLQNSLQPKSIFWIVYPKQSSKLKSDLNRDILHAKMPSLGWDTVRAVAVDKTWSGLRFKAI